MRDFYLNEVIKHYWPIIDPYLNNEEERDLFGLCMNTIVKYRAKLGLPDRPKGRPKTILQFKDTHRELPEKVRRAISEIKKEVKRMQDEYQKHKEQIRKQKEQKQLQDNKAYENMKNQYRTNNINKENK